MSWYDPTYAYAPEEIAEELGAELPPIVGIPAAVQPMRVYAGKDAPGPPLDRAAGRESRLPTVATLR